MALPCNGSSFEIQCTARLSSCVSYFVINRLVSLLINYLCPSLPLVH